MQKFTLTFVFLIFLPMFAYSELLPRELPEDDILVFGAYAQDSNAVDAETPVVDSSVPQPGASPSISSGSIPVHMLAGLTFPASGASAEADLYNPENSGISLRYTLSLTPQAMADGAGISVSEPVILFQSGLVNPGQLRKTIFLSPLPDGSRLPPGTYEAHMLIESYDAVSHLKGAGDLTIELPLTVLCGRWESAEFLEVFNGGAQSADYQLAFSAQALYAATGRKAYGLFAQPQYAFAVLPLGSLTPGEKQAFSLQHPGEDTIASGTLEGWLLCRNGTELTCLGKVTILADTWADLSGLTEADLDIAQQVVNAQYYLSLESSHSAVELSQVTQSDLPASPDPSAVPIDEARLVVQAGRVPVGTGTVFITPQATLINNRLGFCLGNPATNTMMVLADLRDGDGTLLYRTGALAPGQMLDGLTLSATAQSLSQGALTFQVYAWDPDTLISLGAATATVDLKEVNDGP